MFGGHVSAQDGKSDLEQPSIITRVFKGWEWFVGWCPDLWHCSKKPDSHTQIYICIYAYTYMHIYIYIYSHTHTHTHISSSLNLLLKFIYVTGWLDPKSCVYIFINKILPVPLLSCSLSLHKLKPCLVEYIVILVVRDRMTLTSNMSYMFTNDPIGSNHPYVQVWLGSQMPIQWVLVDLCSPLASGTGLLLFPSGGASFLISAHP